MQIIRKRRLALITKAAQLNGTVSEKLLDLIVPHAQDEDRGKREGLERCHGCGIGVTLEWRKGPDGPKSLCDSCGVSIYLPLSIAEV
jgi:hypothetical protein